MKLQIHGETHHQNIDPHGSQQVLQNPGLSFAKNAKIKCTMMFQEIPSVQPSIKIQPLHYEIHKIYTFFHPCTKGLSSTIFIKIESVTLNLG